MWSVFAVEMSCLLIIRRDLQLYQRYSEFGGSSVVKFRLQAR
jgi:hypothetical protein